MCLTVIVSCYVNFFLTMLNIVSGKTPIRRLFHSKHDRWSQFFGQKHSQNGENNRRIGFFPAILHWFFNIFNIYFPTDKA